MSQTHLRLRRYAVSKEQLVTVTTALLLMRLSKERRSLDKRLPHTCWPTTRTGKGVRTHVEFGIHTTSRTPLATPKSGITPTHVKMPRLETNPTDQLSALMRSQPKRVRLPRMAERRCPILLGRRGHWSLLVGLGWDRQSALVPWLAGDARGGRLAMLTASACKTSLAHSWEVEVPMPPELGMEEVRSCHGLLITSLRFSFVDLQRLRSMAVELASCLCRCVSSVAPCSTERLFRFGGSADVFTQQRGFVA